MDTTSRLLPQCALSLFAFNRHTAFSIGLQGANQKALSQSISNAGSVRHQIRTEPFEAYLFQRTIRFNCFDSTIEPFGKFLILLPQADTDTWAEEAA